MPLTRTPERITMMPDNIDYPLYTQRAKHVDDTVLGTLALLLGLVFIAGGGLGIMASLVQQAHTDGREVAALHCARTLVDFTDANIVSCYTSRGLPVPGDL